MRKSLVLLVLFMVSAVLAGCFGPDKEAEPYIEKGDAAVVDEKYKEALKYYADAYNKDAHEDIMKKITTTRDALIEELNKEYNGFFKEKEYEKAHLVLKELAEYESTFDDKQTEKYDKWVETIGPLLEGQKLLDEYITWVKPHVQKLNTISNDWINAKGEYQIGSSTKAQTEKKVHTLYLENQKVLSEIEFQDDANDESLAETHRILYDIVLNNGRSLMAVLEEIRENNSTADITKAGLPVENSKGDLSLFKASLKSYASTYDLKDTYQSIQVPTKKEGE